MLCDRRHDAVQSQIDDELAVVIGDVPESDSGDAELRVRRGVRTLNAVERVLRREGCEDAIAVIEGIVQVFEQIRFCLGLRRATLLTVLGRSLPFHFIEEGELGAGHVFYLLAEGSDAIEVSGRGDVGILGLGHGFRDGEETFLGPTERTANAI